jgi:hypothetical protein
MLLHLLVILLITMLYLMVDMLPGKIQKNKAG